MGKAARQSVTELNQRRKKAVELRLGGLSIAETRAETGLSAPTIIAAFKAYRSGGWPAVNVGRRGRPTTNSTSEKSELEKSLISAALLSNQPKAEAAILWNTEQVQQWLSQQKVRVSRSTVLEWMAVWNLQPDSRYEHYKARYQPTDTGDSANVLWQGYERFIRRCRRRGTQTYWLSNRQLASGHYQLYAHDLRGKAFWVLSSTPPNFNHYRQFLSALLAKSPKGMALILPGEHLQRAELGNWLQKTGIETHVLNESSSINQPLNSQRKPMTSPPKASLVALSDSETPQQDLTHLQQLEADSIQIMREVVAEANKPVMLYSVGKDSAVMLHLARKAFYPAIPPFPLLHVDTGWKFRAMYEFRDAIVNEYDMELLTHTNPEGLRQKVNPFTHGSALHTDIMKTQALKQALDAHQFDIAFGGARRDEEKSRAKERVFSFRTAQHRWDAKNQRPELWQLYNARKHPGESIRAFPLSNWTELDIWQYIRLEEIPIVPLYYAAERPVVERDGTLIMVDDERMPLRPNEVPEMKSVRFRTLGCYPLTGAVESSATSLEEIIQEMLLTRTSERQGRMIDHDSAASMEKKKQEGYF